MGFENEFKNLTGFKPMNWQSRLYCEYFVKGNIPASLDLPTGLGKTSVMVLWYLARKAGANLPRRLVYVVDRRAVVDQATTMTHQIKERSSDPDLRISTLRGQYVDNREWLEDPGKPAIIVGTVDMIGSRLLFSGYGVSRKTRSYHAGLLGADTLVVLDESHLVPPFERLLEAIERDVKTLGAWSEGDRAIVPPFRLLSLSATEQKRNGASFHLDKSKGDINDKGGINDVVVVQRLGAKKHLSIETVKADPKEATSSEREGPGSETAEGENTEANLDSAEEGSDEDDAENKKVSVNKKKAPELDKELAKRAWALSGEGKESIRILVYCNSREVADKTKQAIEATAKTARTEVEAELFVGARRVHERLNAAKRLEQLGFLGSENATLAKPTFVVSTSAGEVGVDMDADHMVCDLVEWERMVQRFGRVNRKGEGNAKIVLLVEPQPTPNEKEQKALAKQKKGGKLTKTDSKQINTFEERLRSWKARQVPLAYLPQNELGIDISPGALLGLKSRAQEEVELQKIIESASTSPPLYPALSRALVDAWSMTSLEVHTGRPEVAPWLRGWVDDVPQTTLIWRKYLPVCVQGEEPRKRDIEAFFDAAPPHLSEKLETETWRVIDWLGKRAVAFVKRDKERADSVVAFALDDSGNLRQSLRATELVPDDDKGREKKRKEALEEKILPGATLIVDLRLGGLSDDGLLNAGKDSDGLHTADDGDDWPAEIGFRVFLAAGDEIPDKPSRITFSFATRQSSEGEDIERLLVETTKTEDSRATSSHPQLLEEHQSWAEERGRKIAEAVGLTGDYAEVVAVAARLHDEGKRAARWQRAFNAKNDGIYAKTKGPLVFARLGGYRHEFGSLPYAEKDEQLNALPQELQDLVLHLIAAHHGRARPVIGTDGCEDAPPSVLEGRARDVALRFAQLQKQWGPLGLAWWEALLRAADQQASRDNDNRGKDHG